MAYVGYIRVSTKDQNLDRQREKMLALGVDERFIIEEKASGKDFNRAKYLVMKEQLLREGDILYLDSLDRLGRDYEGIIQEWKYITRVINADIIVIDQEGLFNSKKFKELGDLGRLLEDQFLSLLAYVATTERNKLKSRQAEGIKIAKAKGIKLGRPAATLNQEHKLLFEQWVNGEITAVDLIRKTGFSKTTVYALAKKNNYVKSQQ